MAGPVRIRPVEGRKDLDDFIRFPWKVYCNDNYWVPPIIREQKRFLSPEKNPFYKHSEVALFLAERDGKTVGRIAAIVNRNHNKFYNDRTGFFGLFESVDDQRVADQLFSTAREWLRERDMDLMRGPMNLSTNDECGLLIEGFDSSPMIMMTYNPRYYICLIEQGGFRKGKDLFAFYMNTSQEISEKLIRVAEEIKNQGRISLHTLNMKRFDEEVEKIKAIYNSAWSGNWGFVPMTDEEFYHTANELRRIAVPELVLIAEVNGEPAAFSVTVPDYNQVIKRLNGRLGPISLVKLLWYSRKVNQLRLMLLGIRAGYRKRGIDSLLYTETFKTAKRLGYIGGEMSWILEDNILTNRAIEIMGGKLYKKYRIYEKEL